MKKYITPLCILLCTAVSGMAQIQWDQAQNGVFGTGSNWTGGNAPGATDEVSFTFDPVNPDPFTVSFDADATTRQMTANPSNVIFDLDGNTWTQNATGDFVISGNPSTQMLFQGGSLIFAGGEMRIHRGTMDFEDMFVNFENRVRFGGGAGSDTDAKGTIHNSIVQMGTASTAAQLTVADTAATPLGGRSELIFSGGSSIGSFDDGVDVGPVGGLGIATGTNTNGYVEFREGSTGIFGGSNTQIGRGTNASGELLVTGSGSSVTITSNNVQVAVSGDSDDGANGIIRIEGGGTMTLQGTTQLRIGFSDYSAGQVLVSSSTATPSTLALGTGLVTIGDSSGTSTGLLRLGANSSLTRTSGNAFTIQSGGTLEIAGGSASLSDSNIDMYAGGTLDFSAGSLTTSGALRSRNNGANFSFTLNNSDFATAPLSFNNIQLRDTATSIGNLNILLSSGFSAAVNDEFFLISYTGSRNSNIFTGLTNGSQIVSGNYTFEIFYDDPSKLIYLNTIAIPEPSAALLLLVGLSALLLLRKRDLASTKISVE